MVCLTTQWVHVPFLSKYKYSVLLYYCIDCISETGHIHKVFIRGVIFRAKMSQRKLPFY